MCRCVGARGCTVRAAAPNDRDFERARGFRVRAHARAVLAEPPRSHYDSVTQRLTLNMDHFCPWVVNTVGFYNRKFFMLFLVYVNLTLVVALIMLGTQASAMMPWIQDEEHGAPARWPFPRTLNVVMFCGAIGIDALLLLCLVGPFMVFHLNMAAHNETTIESGTNPHYDVGALRNLRSVFGREMWTWPLPLYLHGPDGDGIHWPTVGAPHDYSRRSTVPAPSCSVARAAPTDLACETAAGATTADLVLEP
jgi:hypothetical protein